MPTPESIAAKVDALIHSIGPVAPPESALKPLEPRHVTDWKPPEATITIVQRYFSEVIGLATDFSSATILPLTLEGFATAAVVGFHPQVSRSLKDTTLAAAAAADQDIFSRYSMGTVRHREQLDGGVFIYARTNLDEAMHQQMTAVLTQGKDIKLSPQGQNFVRLGTLVQLANAFRHDEHHRQCARLCLPVTRETFNLATAAIVTDTFYLAQGDNMYAETREQLTRSLLSQALNRGTLVFEGALVFVILDGFRIGAYGYDCSEAIIDKLLIDAAAGFVHIAEDVLGSPPEHADMFQHLRDNPQDAAVGSSETSQGRISQAQAHRFLQKLQLDASPQLLARELQQHPLLPRLLALSGDASDIPSTLPAVVRQRFKNYRYQDFA